MSPSPVTSDPVQDNEPACRALSREAARTVVAATSSVHQCAADADCVPLDIEAKCWAPCLTSSLGGNQAARNALASATYNVNALCGSSRQLGCSPTAIDCPGQVVGSSFRCDQGKCVLTDPITCNELGQQAWNTVVAAASSVVQCVADADCVPVPLQVPCGGGCSSTVIGNQNVRDAVAAKAGEVAQLCGRFSKAGCVVIPAGCPPAPPLTYRCQQGKCAAAP